MRPNPYLLITVASWGFNFVALKEAYKQFDPPALALARFFAMWTGLILVCIVRRESLRFPRGDAMRLLYLGFVSMGLYMVLFLQGMRGSAPTVGAILLQMSPVCTALLAAMFKQEKLKAGAVLGAIVAFSGTAMIVYSPSGGHDNSRASNLIVLSAAAVWAYSVILMRPLLVKYSPLRVLTLSMAGGLPVIVAYGTGAAFREPWSSITPYGWAMFFHISIVSGVLAFLCFYQGVKQVGGPGATLYQFLVPIAAMLFAAIVEGARLTTVQGIGFLVVLGGVGYALRSRIDGSPETRETHADGVEIPAEAGSSSPGKIPLHEG